MGSLRVPPASVPGAHAFASCAHDLKLKSRSFHCFLGGPSAIPWLTRYVQLFGRNRSKGSNPFLSASSQSINYISDKHDAEISQYPGAFAICLRDRRFPQYRQIRSLKVFISIPRDREKSVPLPSDSWNIKGLADRTRFVASGCLWAAEGNRRSTSGTDLGRRLIAKSESDWPSSEAKGFRFAQKRRSHPFIPCLNLAN